MTLPSDWQTTCENEPLAFSNAIQAHGVLLCLDSTHRITHVSANIGDFFPELTPEALLEQPLPEAWAKLWSNEFHTLKGNTTHRSQCKLDFGSQALFDVILIDNDDVIIVELQPSTDDIQLPPLAWLMLRSPMNPAELTILENDTTDLIRKIIGCDRVMIYRFRDDGDGEVIAETHSEAIIDRYLGFRFPASDIPKIARDLYLQTPWRAIPNAPADAINLLSKRSTIPDLTRSNLRSLSPFHQRYLANMGVAASVSFSIIIQNKLWGLIACHHLTPRYLSFSTLQKAALTTQAYASRVAQWQAKHQIESMRAYDDSFGHFRTKLSRKMHPALVIATLGDSILKQLEACGMVLQVGKDVTRFEETLPTEAILQLNSCHRASQGRLDVLENLTRLVPELQGHIIAGALGIHLSAPNNDEVHAWIFRRAETQIITWGGDPQKPVECSNLEDEVLSPRHSFNAWHEKRQDFCKPWQEKDRLFALYIVQLLNLVFA